MVTVAPYGSWSSPFTEDKITQSSVRFGQLLTDKSDIYWLEGRPEEAGRGVIVKANEHNFTEDMIPAPYSVGSRAHEYGGGDFCVRDGEIWFVNSDDQNIYHRDINGTIRQLTVKENFRFADLILDQKRNRLIAVGENHAHSLREPENLIVAIDLETGETHNLVQGADFYLSPKISPDGSKLCWIEWYHPNLPWDETFLKIAEFNDIGEIHSPLYTLGGEKSSLIQPKWFTDQSLTYVDDKSGWWNIFKFDLTNQTSQNITPYSQEYGAPAWIFGQSNYTIGADQKIYAAPVDKAVSSFSSYDLTGQERKYSLPLTEIHDVHNCENGTLAFIGGAATKAATIYRFSPISNQLQEIKASAQIDVAESYISTPETICFETSSGDVAYGFYYPPQNPDYTADPKEKPPLMVKSHGGPTANTTATYAAKIQYWTSRGFGFLDVNYRGSTGFGTAYRKKLNGQWGVYDVEDCIKGAEFLAKEGRVDQDRMAISGGSAGGFTVLCALTFHNCFKAGASYYGVADLKALMAETHKFEAHYDDSLIGPEDIRDQLYFDRSPVNFPDQLTCPVIFFQGLLDKVVPPSQPEKMVTAMRRKKLPVSYVTFENERHGFRQAETIQKTLSMELTFYSKFFEFTPYKNADDLIIENLA